MKDALYLAVTVNADINTTYIMGTPAMMLHVALLWTYVSLSSAVFVCAAFHTAVRVDVAFSTAVGVCAALHTAVRVDAAHYNAVGVGVALPAVGVCAVLHTAARVDAAPFTAVGVDAAFLLLLVNVMPFTLLLG